MLDPNIVLIWLQLKRRILLYRVNICANRPFYFRIRLAAPHRVAYLIISFAVPSTETHLLIDIRRSSPSIDESTAMLLDLVKQLLQSLIQIRCTDAMFTCWEQDFPEDLTDNGLVWFFTFIEIRFYCVGFHWHWEAPSHSQQSFRAFKYIKKPRQKWRF
jgi:hypothetical protein